MKRLRAYCTAALEWAVGDSLYAGSLAELHGQVGVLSPHRSEIRSQHAMHEIIYLIGLVVVVMFVLGMLGLR